MSAAKLVILSWLMAGDLRPLRAALLRGWVMGREVQQRLGSMLLDDNEEYCCIDDPTGRQTSHQLIVRQRGPGNPRKPENFVRDIDLVANDADPDENRLILRGGDCGGRF